jgi:hypothetical protein
MHVGDMPFGTLRYGECLRAKFGWQKTGARLQEQHERTIHCPKISICPKNEARELFLVRLRPVQKPAFL